ncbi:MAG: anaerobic ribonucleoside-triphosphate reductase activating protein [Bacillota bacterium]|jgi:anaerobic ribonucleoside-triphosphate reductase activating protein
MGISMTDGPVDCAHASSALDFQLRLAGIVDESVVDGPGVRLVIFAQGCPHHCPRCHNPHTWNMDGGALVAAEEIVERLRANPVLAGVTLSGGEPFAQASEFGRLAAAISRMSLSVMAYTGYTWENIVQWRSPGVRLLLDNTDILVDGPYVDSLRKPGLKWRGSSNQRIIDVQASLNSGGVALL